MKPIKSRSSWSRLPFFPWIEIQREYTTYGSLQTSEWRWRWYQEPAPEPIKPVALPERLLFDWKRDYAPLWEPGSRAFWLEPEPGDLPAGDWPLPTIKQRPGVTVNEHGVIFYEEGMSYLVPKVYVRIYGT